MPASPATPAQPGLDAVTFDFWNTLIRQDLAARDMRLNAWLGLLEGAGFACERQQLDAVYDDTWEAYVRKWHANEQFQAVQAAEHLLEGLGFDVPADLRDELVEAFASAGVDAPLQPADGVAGCLQALKGVGLRLGIICDVGFMPSTTLRAHLSRHGLLELFDHWSFSDEVGHYKPSPVIFEHALEGLGGVAPARAAHVGDIRRTDIAGARAMGMVAVRYRGISDDTTDQGPEGDHVIDHHGQLPEVLGLA